MDGTALTDKAGRKWYVRRGCYDIYVTAWKEDGEVREHFRLKEGHPFAFRYSDQQLVDYLNTKLEAQEEEAE